MSPKLRRKVYRRMLRKIRYFKRRNEKYGLEYVFDLVIEEISKINAENFDLNYVRLEYMIELRYKDSAEDKFPFYSPWFCSISEVCAKEWYAQREWWLEFAIEKTKRQE